MLKPYLKVIATILVQQKSLTEVFGTERVNYLPSSSEEYCDGELDI